MPLEAHLLIGLILGIICAAVASSKGRSVVVWFLLGFLFGLIPLIIVACLSNVKEEKSYREHQARENRRLREQLRQEQLKAEAFRQHTQTRLDTHDHQLGVDTRSTYTALPGQHETPMMLDGPQPQAVEELSRALEDNGRDAQAPPPPPGAMGRQWHYERNGTPIGPVAERQLLAMLKAGQITGDTLLWTEDLGDWKAANQIGALRPFITS